jgi:hypothetical protein
MRFETNKEKGRAGMALAIAYFGSNGYTISIPLNDTQWYDLVIEKEGIFQTVQCKATDTEDNTIYLRSCGGHSTSVYDNVLDHPVDLLFCLDSKQHMFVIPVEDIRASGNLNSISLREAVSKFANKNSFDTSKYLVKI